MKIILAVLLIFLTASCTMRMSSSDFNSEVQRCSASSFSGGMSCRILYKGSDIEFHYFYISPKVGIPRSVKVNKDELYISDEFPLSDEKVKWIDYYKVK
jgi:hypothetical protein